MLQTKPTELVLASTSHVCTAAVFLARCFAFRARLCVEGGPLVKQRIFSVLFDPLSHVLAADRSVSLISAFPAESLATSTYDVAGLGLRAFDRVETAWLRAILYRFIRFDIRPAPVQL